VKDLLVGLAFLLLLSLVAVSCRDKTDDSDTIKALEARVKALENRLTTSLAPPWFGEAYQVDRLERLERRIDRLESEVGTFPFY